jgi:hypothetical protein
LVVQEAKAVSFATPLKLRPGGKVKPTVVVLVMPQGGLSVRDRLDKLVVAVVRVVRVVSLAQKLAAAVVLRDIAPWVGQVAPL